MGLGIRSVGWGRKSLFEPGLGGRKLLGELLRGIKLASISGNLIENPQGPILNFRLMNLRNITANGRLNHFWSCSLAIPQTGSKA